MKVLVGCLLLCFLGVTIASPAPSWPDFSQWYNTYSRALNGGQERDEKITQAQSYLDTFLNNYHLLSGGGQKQTSRDEVTALMENLLNAQHTEKHNDDSEAAMQSFFKVMAKIEDEKAKEMDSQSARAQFLTGLGDTLSNAGKNYLVDRYCPNADN